MTNLVNRDSIKINAVFGAAKKVRTDMPNNWRVTLRGFGRRLTVDFYSGSAVRDVNAEAVLSSLCLDTTAGDDSFEEFCANFGYDTDSRSALETYKACARMGRKVRAFLGDHFNEYASAEY